MHTALCGPLKQAALATFEELCFVCVGGPQEEDLPALTAAAAVRFHGPRRGWLELRCSAAALSALTENMLGGVDASAALQRDALGELANVICGNLLPTLAGPEAVYRLDAPGVPPQAWGAATLAACAPLLLERGAVEMRLFLEAA